MPNSRKKILIFGLGYFMRELVKELLKSRPCIAVDSDPAAQEDWAAVENLSIYTGDANSIVLWKKLPLEEVSHIVFSLPDDDVAGELCRIAREIFHLDIPIISVAHRSSGNDILSKYNVSTVDPLANGINAVRGLVQQNYAVPANVGLGKGELVEVTIVRRSHLVDKKLRYLESYRWRVAAIYRNGELALPNGESELRVGDKVLLAGDPQVLTNIVNILMQGIPRFPLQYGRYINVVPRREPQAAMEEANYIRFFTQAVGISCCGNAEMLNKAKNNSVVDSMKPHYVPAESFKDKSIFKDAGILVIPAAEKSLLPDRRHIYFLRKSPSPVLLAKGVFPYTDIIVMLNSINPDYVLQVALELSRLSGLSLKAVYSTVPKNMRNAEANEELAAMQKLVREFENIERLKIDYTVLSGNPIKTLEAFRVDYPRSLVVVGNNRDQRISFFQPHIPFLLSRRLNASILVVPVNDTEG
jgi:Trk K+ transport system NAD-binding subunit